MEDATTTSTTAAPKGTAEDRHVEEQLLLLVLINFLRRQDLANTTAADDDNAPLSDQSAISKELLIIAQRLIDAQLGSVLGGEKEEEKRAITAVTSSVASVMDNEAAAKKKKRAAKKKRNRRNKTRANYKRAKFNGMSWLGGVELIPKMIMMALSSIAVLIATLSLVHHSVNGSGEGNLPPALQPTASKSLPQKDLQLSNEASTSSGNIISSPVAAVESPPDLLPNTFSVSNRHLQDGEESCLDTPNWKDVDGVGCDWYEEEDEKGCPKYGAQFEGDMGVANEHCCHCGGGSHTLPPTTSLRPSLSPSISASPTEFCLDTPNWKHKYDEGCDWYEKYDVPECPNYGDWYEGDMGVANEHCCYCGGGSRTCEDIRLNCQKYFSVSGVEDGILTPLCKEADSCPCGGINNNFTVSVEAYGNNSTLGLYNECKCDFWSRLCEDTGVGVACDYAAGYCCGDYAYYGGDFVYLNSPTCYCDFFNYAKSEFGHTLKPKAINTTIEFSYLCSFVWSDDDDTDDDTFTVELQSLKKIYNETNGKNWTNNAGWMNDTLPHCQWYGISCNEDGLVAGIALRDNNLEGRFPVYTRDVAHWGDPVPESYWQVTKYGLANLYFLETLDLANNNLTGTIDYRPLYNLQHLTHFDVSGNRLSGGMDALITPSISRVNFNNNLFTSIHRFQPHKVSALQTLRYCDVSNNAIEIDASDLLQNIPPNIEEFIASNNNIHGSLSASLNRLPQLRQFKMSNNALSGILPTFADSSNLQELDLSNQNKGVNGSIPEEFWIFQFLKTLNLAGNKLTGTIPLDITNMAVLAKFDVSNNLLSGRIPSQIGTLEGTLNYLGLANNSFSGEIPSQLGQLWGASVFLKGNNFDTKAYAPLSLCTLVGVEACDLADNTTLCPTERNALSDFYKSAKGAEWTDDANWTDEYLGPCAGWHRVECVDGSVTKLDLRNNGLSGRLSQSIGELTSIKRLDLSDNDIKGPIPTEIGLLSKLTYLRLSYNAFTGTAPQELTNLKRLQLLQLQSNRITDTSFISDLVLDETMYNVSAFVTDCGVPSAFEEALDCTSCTMCCNANEDCHPQEKTRVQKMGFNNYSEFAAALFAVFAFLCCTAALFLYRYHKNRRNASSSTMSMQNRLEEDDEYALSRIGKDSVYSYFVKDKIFGWVLAFVTIFVQTFILVFFVVASETNLQDDKIDIEFSWKCPLDSDICQDKSDLTNAGWASFWMLMLIFLAKDMVNGVKLIYYSSQIGRPFWRWSRIRYFVGGWSLCSITLFALYVSTVYNRAIATSNTDIILNAVVVLFVMEMDEYIFATLEAINDKWTAHADDSEDAGADAAVGKGDTTEDMKKEIASQKAKIASQQEELMLQKEQIARQSDEIAILHEAVQKIQESVAVSSESMPQCTAAASDSVFTHRGQAEGSDSVVGMGVAVNEVEVEDETGKNDMIVFQEGQEIATQREELSMPCNAEQEQEEEAWIEN